MSFKTVVTPPQMKPNRPNQPVAEVSGAQQPKAKPRKPSQWGFAVRVIVSLLVMWHLACVFLAPLSIEPSSPLVVQAAQGKWYLPIPFSGWSMQLGQPMQWYLDALYLNHGYHFFAPEPSNGHMIRYQVYDDRGQIKAQGEFPSKKDYWPRLFYHRYFMLADQCEVNAATEAEANQWKRAFLTAYAQQLLREHDGAQVRVQRVVHYPAYLQDVLKGMKLDDPQTYQGEEPVVTQRRQDLNLPSPNQTNQSGQYYQYPNNVQRQNVAGGWQGGLR